MSGSVQAPRLGPGQAQGAPQPSGLPPQDGAGRGFDTAWMDFARVAGMVAVVTAHVFAPAIRFDIAEVNSPAWWTGATISAIARFCVPLFILISGALLLAPAAGRRPREFYRRRLHRIGVPLAAWCAFYLGLRYFTADDGLNLASGTRELAGGTVYYHLYFLFVLGGLYAITPFLRVIVLHSSTRMLAAFAGVMLALGMADQAFTRLLQTGASNAVTQFLPYIGYFVAGLLLARLPLTRRLVAGAAAAFIGGVVLTTVGGWALARGLEPVYVEYVLQPLSPSVILTAFGAMILLRAFAARKPRIAGAPAVAKLSALTFGVYLVHPAVLTQLHDRADFPTSVTGMLSTGGTILVITLAAATIVTAIGRRIPGVRAIF